MQCACGREVILKLDELLHDVRAVQPMMSEHEEKTHENGKHTQKKISNLATECAESTCARSRVISVRDCSNRSCNTSNLSKKCYTSLAQGPDCV